MFQGILGVIASLSSRLSNYGNFHLWFCVQRKVAVHTKIPKILTNKVVFYDLFQTEFYFIKMILFYWSVQIRWNIKIFKTSGLLNYITNKLNRFDNLFLFLNTVKACSYSIDRRQQKMWLNFRMSHYQELYQQILKWFTWVKLLN